MKIGILWKATVLTLSLWSCKSAADPALELRILDLSTGQPVQNAEVRVLEEGPPFFTDADGKVFLEEKDLANPVVTAESAEPVFAFSAVKENYRKTEFNAAKHEKTVVYLANDSVTTYRYQKPVQLADGLATGTLQAGLLDSVRIKNLMTKIKAKGYQELHSVLIFRENKLVFEEYFRGNNDTIKFEEGILRDRSPDSVQWSRTGKHYVASVNKALTATLAGIALNEKGLTSDAKIAPYLPAYSAYFLADTNKAAVSFHHALNMASGFRWNEWSGSDLILVWRTSDFTDFMLQRPNFGQRSGFSYNSALTNTVIRALANLVETDFRVWAHNRFYGKLGITDYTWQNQPGGLPEGAARMYLRPRDLMKIGVMYLNAGRWNGEQIVPEAWAKRSFTKQMETPAFKYSYGFWIKEVNGVPFVQAEGDGGISINMFPTKQTVVVVTQGNYLQNSLYVAQLNDMLSKYIVPAMQ